MWTHEPFDAIQRLYDDAANHIVNTRTTTPLAVFETLAREVERRQTDFLDALRLGHWASNGADYAALMIGRCMAAIPRTE